MKLISARIDKKTGKVTIETQGYEGASCLEATKALEEGLGLKDPERELTADYYKVETDNNQSIGGQNGS